MNVDQRLHRAAHDLREVEIDVPPLAVGTTRPSVSLRRLGAPVATVMLFALGVVATTSDAMPATMAGGQMASEVAIAADSPSPRSVVDGSDRQLSPLEELAMISALPRQESPAAQSSTFDPAIPPGAS